jgi:hypothetical protein
MKTWPLFVSIVVILALVCSPVLAISKSDVILKYRMTNYDEFNYPFVIDKSDAGREPSEIIDYGPSPSPTRTVAEWLNGQSGLPWGFLPGISHPGSQDGYIRALHVYSDPYRPSRGTVPAWMCGDC